MDKVILQITLIHRISGDFPLFTQIQLTDNYRKNKISTTAEKVKRHLRDVAQCLNLKQKKVGRLYVRLSVFQKHCETKD